MRAPAAGRVRKWLRWLFAAACAWPLSAAAEPPMIIGWIERVRLEGGLLIAAKLDTGAQTASLHASGLRKFVRDGGEWVAFDVVDANGKSAHFERKVVRLSTIKRLGGKPQDRPTVLLGICLGPVYRLTEVNLVDRSGFNYELLLGRRFLEKRFAVDPARTYTTKPACDDGKAP